MNRLYIDSHPNKKYQDSFRSKYTRLKRKCKDVESIYKVSLEIENSINKLQSIELSKTKYNIELFGWQKTQKTLLNNVDAILENIKRPLDKSTYRYKASFNITLDNIEHIKGYSLLQKLGFYNRQTNPNGVVKDHRFSIKSGILLNIPPKYLGHIDNCEFLTYEDNLVKSSNNSISLDDFCHLTNYSLPEGITAQQWATVVRGD